MAKPSDNILPLSPQSRPEDVEAAIAEQDRRRLMLSGNEFQPKIAWTLHPWSEAALRERVHANTFSPFVVHAVLPLPASALKWPGAPYWAMHAYLVFVEVRATFAR